MGSIKYIRIWLALILLLITMPSYASESISISEKNMDDRNMDNEADELKNLFSITTNKIKEFESKHPTGIPKFHEVRFDDHKELSNYYTNRYLLKFAEQSLDIALDRKEKADRIIEAYKDILSMTGKLNAECDECMRIYKDRQYCYGACMLREFLAKKSAEMALNAATFCTQKGLYAKAKQLYREIIITYTGDAYRSYVKQAEFGIEDLKELEQQHNKKKSSKK